jgi:hypothetical protein
MISNETSVPPNDLSFDLAVAAVGYERRCRWIAENCGISAEYKLGLEFGFLREESYAQNRAYFEGAGWHISLAKGSKSFDIIWEVLTKMGVVSRPLKVFIDISSMSREMMANVALAVNRVRLFADIEVTIAYAPSGFSGSYAPAPIRLAAPITPTLAGWSSRPDKPLGVIMGLGCEPGLALGALQVLEPNKAWVYSPRGFDSRFEESLSKANEHVADIFDVTLFNYDISDPVTTRGRIDALINAVDRSFRLICIPFGPKIYAWTVLSTVVFEDRRDIGVWSFSSKEHAIAIDRDVSGEIVWHKSILSNAVNKNLEIER